MTVCSGFLNSLESQFCLSQASVGEARRLVSEDGKLMGWACFPHGQPFILSEESPAGKHLDLPAADGQLRRSRDPGVAPSVAHCQASCAQRPRRPAWETGGRTPGHRPGADPTLPSASRDHGQVNFFAPLLLPFCKD